MKKFYTLFLCLSFLSFSYVANAACSITVLSVVNTCGANNNGQIEIRVNDPAGGSSGPFTISWTGAATNSSGSFTPSNPNDFTYTLTGLVTGSYTITATGGGCVTSITQSLTSTALPAHSPAYNTVGGWNVYCYQASGLLSNSTSSANMINWAAANYRGFYTALPKNTISTPPGCGGSTNCAASFEFNSKDGWDPWKNPSGATTTANSFGQAATAYAGCNLPNDKYGFLAKRKGFPCGYYYITKYNIDDDVRVTIKPDGINSTQFVVPLTTGCTGSACNIWVGYLGPNSIIDLECFDNSNDAKFQIEFYRDDTGQPQATANAGPDKTKCNGTPLNITGSATGGGGATGAAAAATDYTYSWSPIASLTNATSATMTTAINANTTYTVTVTDKTGCTATDAMVVTVAPANTIAITMPINICKSSTSNLVLNYTSATAGTHSINVSGSSALIPFPVTISPLTLAASGTFSVPLPTISSVAVGTYNVTITDTNPSGCTKTNIVVLTIGNNPTLSFPSTNCSVSSGASTTVTATGGLAAYTYAWSPAPTSGGTTASPNINFAGSSAISYSTTVTDAAGCSTTGSVAINPKPFISQAPNYDVCGNASSILLSYTSGAGFGLPSDYTYSISAITTTMSGFVNVTNVPLTSLMLAIPNPTPVGIYNFSMTIKKISTGCTSNPLPFTISVGAPITAVITSSIPQLGCAANAVLTATPSGSTYAWSNAITTATNTVTTANTYMVTVTKSGCTSTASFVLAGGATAPTLTQSIEAPGKLTCSKPSLIITATAVGGTAPFTWSGIGFTSPTATTAIKTVSIGSNNSVTVTDKNGCATTTTIVVDDRTGPSAGIYPGFPKICGTTPLILTATPPTATAYAWTGSSNTATKSIAAAGLYTVTVTDINGCVGNASVTAVAAVQPTFTTADASVCKGANATISATGASGFDEVTGTSGWVGTDIPNSISTGLSTPITLTGGTGTVSATSTIRVNLSISHRFIDDLDAYLVGPGNCGAMLLFNDIAGKSMTGTTLTTGAGTVIMTGLAPFAGTYKMLGAINTNPILVTPPTGTVLPTTTSLSAGSCPVNGDWKLLLFDDFGATAGSLLNWSIAINNGLGGFTHTYNVTGATASAPTYSGGPTQPNSSSTISGLNTVGYVTGDVSVSNGNGCPTKKNFKITVFGVPAITTLTPTCASTATATDGSIAVAATLDNGTLLAADQGVIEYALSATGPWQTTTNFAGLAAGNYTVYVRNSKSTTCTSSLTITIGFKPTVTLASSTTAIGCGSNSATLTATGGGSYAWDNSLSAVANPTATVTATTTYTVTVTNAGCSNTKSVTINFDKTPPTVTTSAALSTVTCANPSTTLTATGGGTYVWSNALGSAATTAAVSPTTNTTYSVTVTGTNGCTTVKTVDVTVDANIPIATATAATSTVTCTTPSTTLTATGGNTYLWSNSLGTSATSAAVMPTASTTYTVTVTAANGCTIIKSVTVNVDKTAPTATATAATPTVTCTTPSTTLTAGGGTSYNWDNSLGTNATTAAVMPTATTTYNVTVTALNGCTATKTVTVTVDKTAPTATATAATPTVTCTTPSTALTAGGGTSYSWDNGLGINATTAGVTPTTNTTYNVTVTAANGCTATKTITVNVDKTQPTANATATNPTVTCASPSTTLTATGGASYNWSNALGSAATTAAVTPTTNTTYSVTVTGTNGCTSVKTVAVTVDANIPIATATAATSTVTCTIPSTTLTATGGNTYLWSNSLGTSATTAAVTPTTNTTYSVTVTAANGCTIVKSVTVNVDKTAPTPTATAATSPVTCTTPSTTLTAGGGTSYNWDSSLGTNATTAAVMLTATTTYNVTVTALNGCTATKTVTVTVDKTAPTPTATAATPTVTCTTPSTTLTAGGGTSYSWDNGLGINATTAGVTPTTNTTYNVTVTAANGCTATKAITVNVDKTPPTPTATAAIPTVTCTTPSTTLTAGGGTSYNWSNTLGTNATTAAVTPIVTTTYTVTVTAANGCTATKDVIVTVDITTPTATATATTPTVTCTTPSTTLTATGGATYNWSNALGTNATTVPVTPTVNTTYTVTVTASNGCTSTKTVDVIVDKTAPTATATAATPTVTCTTPSTTLTAGGGTSYSWDNSLGTNATTAAVMPTATTTYNVTVTALNGCTATKAVTVTVDKTAPTATATAATPTVTCTTPSTTLTAGGGTTYNWDNSLGINATTAAVTPTVTTTYNVTVTAANGCTATKAITVNVDKTPPTPTATAAIPTVTCTTPSTTLTAGGGTSYSWDNSLGTNATTAAVMPTVNTTYAVTVTADNGCTATKAITANVDKTAPTPTATATTPTVTCTTPSTTLTAGGGTTYNWDNSLGINATTAAVTPTVTTTYNVTVTAANGCTATKDVTVTADITPPTATASAATPKITCNTPSTTLTATGGGNYNWSNTLGSSATTAAVSPAVTTTYSVTVTAANGCSVIKTVNVDVDKDTPNLSITPISPVINCTNTSQVLTATSTNIITAYAWTSPFGTTATATVNPLVTTPYSVTVTADNGCTASQNVTVTVDTALPIVTFTNARDTITCTNTSTTITATGGTFNWSGSLGTNGNISVSPTATTTYTVTITNTNGCFVTKDTTIYINTTKPIVTVSPATITINCAIPSTTLTATGGATYSWSNSAGITPTVTVTPTATTTYTVTVTGSNGCTQTGTALATVNITTPTAAITPTTPVINCNNANANLTASGGITYGWSNSLGATATVTATPTSTTTYNVTVTDVNGCTGTKSVEVKVEDPLVIACAQKSGVTTVTATDGVGEITITGGAPTFTIKYTFGTNPPVTITGANNGSNLIPTLAAGTYDVTVTDASGCSKTCSFSIAGISCNIVLTLTQSTPLSCFGGNNAALNLATSNTTGTKTFAWTPVSLGNTQNPTGLSAGTYEVTVTDGLGCSAISSILINNPTEILVNVDANNDVKCFSDATGSVDVSATGGSTPFQFKIDASAYQSSGVFNNLAVGTHTITAKDANNCTKTITITTAQPPVLALSITNQINTTCNGSNDGEVTVAATGGTPSYEYKLDAGTYAGAPTMGNISLGVHTITVKDANDCTKTVNFTITEPAVVSLSINNIINTTCNGGTDGGFTASANGGTAPYTYKVDAGTFSATATVTGLSAGVHTVVVKDSKGCEQSTTANISEPIAIVLVCEQVSAISAVGATDGIGKVTITNGTAPFTISYAVTPNPATTTPGVVGANTINNLAPGAYNVTVTDSKGCTSVCGFTINNPNCNINTGLTNSKTISCNNGNDGEITVNITGGNAPFTYAWNPASVGTNATATNLVAGTYDITVTDATGCLANASLTINDPTVLVINVNFQPVACNGGKTDVVVTASGGTSPYTGTGTFNVSQGAYTYTVTDAKNCTSSTSITITEPSAMDVQVTVTEPIICNGGTGKVSVTVTGGTAPYTGNGVFVVSEGLTNYVVTDNNGCTKSTSITVTEPLKIELVCEQESPTMTVGGANGTGKVNISNGTTPFKIDYKQGTNPAQTYANGVAGDNLITGLKSGSYNVTVTDANGCTATCGFGVAEVSCNMSAVLTATSSIKCNGEKTANLNLNVTNGQGSLMYKWNDTSLDGTQNPINLGAGNYAVTITDERLCKAIQSITVNQPNKLIANGFAGSLYCGQVSSNAFISASGGTTPYTAGIGTFVQTLGEVAYTVTDTNGCTASVNVIVGETPDLTINCGEYKQTSLNGSNGEAKIEIKNGYPGYTIKWKNTTTSNMGTQTGGTGSSIIKNLEAGDYDITVTDNFGCSKTCDFTITAIQPNCNVSANIEIKKAVTCHDGSDGELLAKPSGGSNPYSYNWSVFAFGSGDNPKNVSPGDYKVTVSDGNNCTIIKNITVPNPPQIVISAIVDSIKCNGNKGEISISAIGGTGTLIGIGTFNEPKGAYKYTVTDSKGCFSTKTVTLLEPSPLVINCVAIGKVTTTSGTEGTAEVSISGAKAPYSLSYGNGTTTGALANLNAGTQSLSLLTKGVYSVTVKDKNGCSDTCTFEILDNIKPGCKISLSLKQDKTINCYGSATASILVTTKDAQDKITYDWTDNTLDGIENPSGLKAGTYTLTVKDTAGCTDTKSITISQPSQLQLTCGATAAVTSLSGKEGKATVSINGGIANYDISYTNGTTTDSLKNAPKGANNLSNLTAGTYTVIVTDKNGCVDTCSFTVNTNIAGCTLSSTLVATKQITCFGIKNGELKLTITGGTAPFTTTWNPIGLPNSGVIPSLGAGTYAATITDAKGCVSNVSATLKDPAPLVLNLSSIALKCFGDSSIVKVTVTGGTLPLTGIGNFKQAAGTKTFTVTDKNGCSISGISTLAQPIKLSLICSAISAENNGNKDGKGAITASGGKAPYTITLTNTVQKITLKNVSENQKQTLDTLTKGFYKIVLTDANGCKDTCSFIINAVLCDLKASINVLQPISCWNTNNGKLSAVITKGTAPFVVKWSNNSTNVLIDDLAAATYKVTISDSKGCIDTAKVTLTKPAQSPVIVVNKIDTINCKNTAVVLSAVDTTKNPNVVIGFQLVFGNTIPNGKTTTVPGVYDLIAIDPKLGCSVTEKVTVYENKKTIKVDAGKELVLNGCIKDTVTLLGSSKSKFINPKWTSISGNLIGNINSLNIKADKAGTYIFAAQEPTSYCESKDTSIITSKLMPLVANAGTDRQVCGDTVQLFANAVNGVWSTKNGGQSTDIKTKDKNATLVTNLALGESRFVWTTTLGTCKTEDEVRVQSIQSKAFATNPDTYQVAQVFGQYNGNVATNDKYYGSISTKIIEPASSGSLTLSPKGNFEYKAIGDKYVGLVLFSYQLCSELCPNYCSDGFATIDVLPAATTLADTIAFTNVFSPNGDGINDVFVIPGIENLDFTEMTVVNRWGDIVFQASPYRNNFDGRYKGKPLPEGTYYYIFRVGQDLIARKIYRGSVTIIK